MTLGDLVRPANEWERVLRECGVKQTTLDRLKWGEVFAAKMRPGVFSKGAAELPDFLATILHESGYMAKLKESGFYSAARIEELSKAAAPGTRWRSLVGRADEISNNEARFFEACYGGRMGNRPEGSGDGAKYPGRCLIGITGAHNYEIVGDIVQQDLLVTPELAEQPYFALDITVAWWEDMVDDSILGDDRKVRVCVNGGCIGLPEVERLHQVVERAL